jgi:hypothetical protein
MDHLYHALHLTNENPNRRVTPEDVAKAYLDRETLGGYDDRMKRRLRNDLVQFDALAEWMEPFASSARSEVEVWLKTEEEMVEQRKETEEINRLNQNWKDSGGYVEEDE